MNALEIIQSAIDSIRSNKIRAGLTVLGVIIGVFAILSLVSLVEGIKQLVTSQFSSLGSNLILVAPGRVSFNTDPAVTFSNNKLKEEDAEDIESQLSEYVVGATPNIRLTKTVTYKDKLYLANIVAVKANFVEITNLKIGKGRAFNELEEKSGNKVAIIGAEVVSELFGSQEALGKKINIAGTNFEVIGVLQTEGFGADERIILPLTTTQRSLGVNQLSGLTIKAKEAGNIDEVMDKVEIVLLGNHKREEFDVLSQKDVLESIQSILNVLSIGLGAVASISLLVGGIGIMNIMLVSVTERTNEIGLRKALGATPSNIAFQFLVESMILSLMGGLIGVALGFILTYLIKDQINTYIPVWAVLMAVGFSVVVGGVFGTFPAVKAGKKDPIEALRYEN